MGIIEIVCVCVPTQQRRLKQSYLLNRILGLFFSKDIAFDIFDQYVSSTRKEASIQLSILDLFCSRDLFSPAWVQLTNDSYCKGITMSENQPPLSTLEGGDVAVESILTYDFPASQIFCIMRSTLLSCLISVVESPESIHQVFGRAIRFFYNNLENFRLRKIRFMIG
ncbi:hypothetical protein JCM33374_g6678 [Metschnikowia sp. JCM 33374]|nr:hypothetical protein JCM33374_g6678 [Metschnikowia sp. JCM 33374]